MISSIEEFYGEAKKNIEVFDKFASKHALIGKAVPDHICYKCGSHQTFENVREIFESRSDYVYQSIISKRRIAIIRFQTPMETSLGPIHYLELSDQKPDNSQKDKFDHVEICAVGWTCEEMVNELKKTENVIDDIKPHHTAHEIEIGPDFWVKCTPGALIDKIKSEEMI